MASRFLPDLFGANNRMPLSYEARLAMMARRRRELEGIDAEAAKLSEGRMVSGHYVGPNAWTALAQAAGAAVKGYHQGVTDKEESELLKERQDEFNKKLGEIPTDKTYVPGDENDPEGYLPRTIEQKATPQDFMRWGGEMAQLGPFGQQVGATAMTRGLDRLLPKNAMETDYDIREIKLPDNKAVLGAVDRKNPRAKPVYIGDTYTLGGDKQPTALEHRATLSAELMRLHNTPNKTNEQTERMHAISVALGTMTPMAVEGGAVKAPDRAAILAAQGPGPFVPAAPPQPGAGPGVPPPGAPPGAPPGPPPGMPPPAPPEMPPGMPPGAPPGMQPGVPPGIGMPGMPPGAPADVQTAPAPPGGQPLGTDLGIVDPRLEAQLAEYKRSGNTKGIAALEAELQNQQANGYQGPVYGAAAAAKLTAPPSAPQGPGPGPAGPSGVPPTDSAGSGRWEPTPPSAAPEVKGVPVDPDAKYRDNPRNAPYLSVRDSPGVTTVVPGTGPQRRLNDDMEKLGKDAVQYKVPELDAAWADLREAWLKARNAAQKLEQSPPPLGMIDQALGAIRIGGGVGGPAGINNLLPHLLTSPEGINLRQAVERLMAIERNSLFGQTLTGNEKESFELMAGTTFGIDDAGFMNAVKNLSKSYEGKKAALFSNYAPIVVDKWLEEYEKRGGNAPHRRAPWFSPVRF